MLHRLATEVLTHRTGACHPLGRPDKAAGGARSKIGSLERLLCSERTALQRSKAKGSWEAERHKQVMAGHGRMLAALGFGNHSEMGSAYLGVSEDEREQLRYPSGWDPGPEAATAGEREAGRSTALQVAEEQGWRLGLPCRWDAGCASSTAFLVTHATLK